MMKMATVSVNMERYNEDEVGVSVWACPIYGGGRVVWCGPCLRLRVGVSACVGGGVVGSAEGREEVATHQLTAQTARVHSTGGEKQEGLHVHTRTDAWTHVGTACTTLSSQCPYVCAHTDTHTSATTHDKVIQVTFTHMQ